MEKFYNPNRKQRNHRDHIGDIIVTDVRYLKVEVDEQDTQSKDNAVTDMYVTVLERFNVALRKARVQTLVVCHSFVWMGAKKWNPQTKIWYGSSAM